MLSLIMKSNSNSFGGFGAPAYGDLSTEEWNSFPLIIRMQTPQYQFTHN